MNKVSIETVKHKVDTDSGCTVQNTIEKQNTKKNQHYYK